MVDKQGRTQNWEQPLISIDTIAVQYNKDCKELRVLVGKRKFEPFIGELSLPGVLLLPEERVLEASVRSLKSKVHVEDAKFIRHLQDVGVSDNPDRDPRGATLSVVILAILDDTYEIEKDDEIVHWVNISSLDKTKLPFDHANLIRKALGELERSFFVDKELTKSLLGVEFSTGAVATIFKALLGATGSGANELNGTNLARKIRLTGWVNQIENKEIEAKPVSNNLFVDSDDDINPVIVPTRKRGRPSVEWTWKEEA